MGQFSQLSGRTARLLAVLLLVVLAACSETKEPYVERPVDKLYNDAVNAMEAENYKDAARLFDEVERQHPYSVWATKAQLMAAYSHYQDSRYDDAIAALNRFLQLHPSNRDAPYAHYLLALCYYEQISDVTRDQKMTQLAVKQLREIINRYPDSKYARDAELKLDLARDHLAGKEMEIGRGYQRRGDYLAAVNRFKTVIENYQTTTHVPEALHRLTECYLALGMKKEAQKSAAVLGHNFPGSEWYIDSYQLVERKQVRKEDDEPWYKFW
jgi:outer membrane protein assembly factor BamD